MLLPLPLGEVDLRSKDGEGAEAVLSRSAALAQQAALQMPFTATTPLVKMRLERSAERDKRENLKIPSAIDAQSASGGHFKSFTPSASRAAAR